MQIIDEHLAEAPRDTPRVPLKVERLSLAKRRWRGVAADGREFGFVLNRPLIDGEPFWAEADALYVIEQLPEPVLEVQSAASFAAAARLGWIIGNLHFQIAIEGDRVLVVDDSAVRQLFEREGIAFTPRQAVFHPLAGGHRH